MLSAAKHLPADPSLHSGCQTLRFAQGDSVRSLRLMPIIADLSALVLMHAFPECTTKRTSHPRSISPRGEIDQSRQEKQQQ
jgi:hypothetical protein